MTNQGICHPWPGCCNEPCQSHTHVVGHSLWTEGNAISSEVSPDPPPHNGEGGHLPGHSGALPLSPLMGEEEALSLLTLEGGRDDLSLHATLQKNLWEEGEGVSLYHSSPQGGGISRTIHPCRVGRAIIPTLPLVRKGRHLFAITGRCQHLVMPSASSTA